MKKDVKEYDEWKESTVPHLLDTLNEFPSVAIDVALLISQLPLIQPRFYSISSSPLVDRNRVKITAAVVSFRTKGGQGPMRYGLCSNYLAQLQIGSKVNCFFRRSVSLISNFIIRLIDCFIILTAHRNFICQNNSNGP